MAARRGPRRAAADEPARDRPVRAVPARRRRWAGARRSGPPRPGTVAPVTGPRARRRTNSWYEQRLEREQVRRARDDRPIGERAPAADLRPERRAVAGEKGHPRAGPRSNSSVRYCSIRPASQATALALRAIQPDRLLLQLMRELARAATDVRLARPAAAVDVQVQAADRHARPDPTSRGREGRSNPTRRMPVPPSGDVDALHPSAVLGLASDTSGRVSITARNASSASRVAASRVLRHLGPDVPKHGRRRADRDTAAQGTRTPVRPPVRRGRPLWLALATGLLSFLLVGAGRRLGRVRLSESHFQADRPRTTPPGSRGAGGPAAGSRSACTSRSARTARRPCGTRRGPSRSTNGSRIDST